MLPFYGKAHVAYIPNGYITGLEQDCPWWISSLIACKVQERMTLQIKGVYSGNVELLGVMVVVEAKHMHADAWRGEAEFNNHHFRLYGAFNQAKDA